MPFEICSPPGQEARWPSSATTPGRCNSCNQIHNESTAAPVAPARLPGRAGRRIWPAVAAHAEMRGQALFPRKH
ncbi:MAG: hypothetical protein R2873_26320 [Caldilineaceae bacterium]